MFKYKKKINTIIKNLKQNKLIKIKFLKSKNRFKIKIKLIIMMKKFKIKIMILINLLIKVINTYNLTYNNLISIFKIKQKTNTRLTIN